MPTQHTNTIANTFANFVQLTNVCHSIPPKACLIRKNPQMLNEIIYQQSSEMLSDDWLSFVDGVKDPMSSKGSGQVSPGGVV